MYFHNVWKAAKGQKLSSGLYDRGRNIGVFFLLLPIFETGATHLILSMASRHPDRQRKPPSVLRYSPLSQQWNSSFSTDDDNDTEVEAVDLDTELNLVTECWVEPQCGTVTNCMEQHRYLQGLKYQEIPQAVMQHISFQQLRVTHSP